MSFKITAKEGLARTGKLKLKHGTVETPAFAPVATRGGLKLLDKFDLEEIGAQILMSNTYHLYLRPGAEKIKESGELHNFVGWSKPIMTDSGGFQAFSLGAGSELGRSKFEYDTEQKKKSSEGQRKSQKRHAWVDEEGVNFRSVYNGDSHRFTPEISIKIQEDLGADMIFAFDECTSPSADYDYTKQSMERTHRWAERCLKAHTKKDQLLFGIIQGGTYKDLRIESAKTISSMNVNGKSFDGIGIGGSFGKKQMNEVLEWIIPKLPEEKPRHLLGIGTITDFFESVKRGVDLFDCVGPQRIARAGYFYISPEEGGKKENKFRKQISNAEFGEDKNPLDSECNCKMCQRFTREYIHHIFRNDPLIGMRITTYHNIYFFVNLMKKIRKAIKNNEFEEMYKQWLG
ncbi:tRNA guanosine(34) transglycosylase Tgt [Candidatus Micrarchaeota archaeon]|nr:tRNA guanosine(34) transglycosylase Tgt [Candidatus Micrarchaeota archaeon]